MVALTGTSAFRVFDLPAYRISGQPWTSAKALQISVLLQIS
jgi:hypothetical protein